jgi:hypothetical protein
MQYCSCRNEKEAMKIKDLDHHPRILSDQKQWKNALRAENG